MEQKMNVTKANLNELYFKLQDVFPLEKYVHLLKEFYKKLEDLRQTYFETKKSQTLLDYINCSDYQVKACIHTAR